MGARFRTGYVLGAASFSRVRLKPSTCLWVVALPSVPERFFSTLLMQRDYRFTKRYNGSTPASRWAVLQLVREMLMVERPTSEALSELIPWLLPLSQQLTTLLPYGVKRIHLLETQAHLDALLLRIAPEQPTDVVFCDEFFHGAWCGRWLLLGGLLGAPIAARMGLRFPTLSFPFLPLPLLLPPCLCGLWVSVLVLTG